MYKQFKGDIKEVMKYVMLSTDEDFPRFCEIIDEAIEQGLFQQSIHWVVTAL
jgi:hypothetical protein